MSKIASKRARSFDDFPPTNELQVLKGWLTHYGITWKPGSPGGPNILIANADTAYGLPCRGVALRIADTDEHPSLHARWQNIYSERGWAARTFPGVVDAIGWLRTLGLGARERNCA